MKHRVKADTFFSKEERERITKIIHDVESRTIGEVVVMVADSSEQYHETEAIGGIFLGSLLSLVITISFFHSSLWSYIPLSFLFFFPSKYLFQNVPVLKPHSSG